MKRKLLVSVLVGIMALSAVACGKEEAAAEPVEQTPEATELNPLDYVTLGDYKGIEVTLDGEYEVTDELLADYVEQQSAQAIPYVEDDSQTEILEDSIVNVDYVGSKDGIAFDGGSAENQLIDIAGNCSAEAGGGYIAGFTSGLVGHSVGDEVAYEVTFPENYGSADLAGQTVIFTFQVNWIATKTSAKDLTAEQMKEYLGVESWDEYLEKKRAELEEKCQYNLESDTRTAVINAVINNATIKDIPQDILDGRVQGYVDSMEQYYCTDGSTLEEYFNANGQDYSVAISSITEQLRTTLEQELIFCSIADTEGMEMDDSKFDAYVQKLMDYYGASTKEDLYSGFQVPGMTGEAYIIMSYSVDQAVQLCVDNAVVNY